MAHIVHDNLEKNENEAKGKRRWFVPVTTTIIGIIFTVIVAWYQINLAEERMIEAEKEREKSVKAAIVAIIEEHVINEKDFDISRLGRLIDLRSKEENLRLPIFSIDLIKKAEFNIINSRYLDFERKERYKSIFDSVYKKYYSTINVDYKGPHLNIVNDLLTTMQQGDTDTALSQLKQVLEAFNSDIEALSVEKTKTSDFDKFFSVFIKDPKLLAMIMASYIGLIVLWRMKSRRDRLRRYEMLAKMRAMHVQEIKDLEADSDLEEKD